MNVHLLLLVGVLAVLLPVGVQADPSVSGELELELLTTEEPLTQAVLVISESLEPHQERVLKAIGVQIESSEENALFVSLSWKMLQKLRDKDYITSLGPDFGIQSLPINGTLETNVETLFALQSPSTNRGNGIKVTLIDSGITTSDARIGSEIDFTGEGTIDAHDRGSKIAEHILAINPNATLNSLKIIGTMDEGRAYHAIQAIDWAIENNTNIIVLGVGGTISNCGSDGLSDAVKKAVDSGILVIAPAGDPTVQSLLSPGCSDKTLSVGLSQSLFPNYPDIVVAGEPFTLGIGMATAHVTAIATLLWSENPSASAEKVKKALLETAEDIGLPVEQQGFGQLNPPLAYATFIGLSLEKIGIDLETIDESFLNTDTFKQLMKEEQERVKEFLKAREEEQKRLAQLAELPPVEVTPDSFWYGIQRFTENIDLLLTFDEIVRAEKNLSLANKRVAEIIRMQSEAKTQFQEQLLADFDRHTADAQTIVLANPELQAKAADQLVENADVLQNVANVSTENPTLDNTHERTLEILSFIEAVDPKKAAELYFSLSEVTGSSLDEKKNAENFDILVRQYQETIGKTQQSLQEAKRKGENVSEIEQKIVEQAANNIATFSKEYQELSQKSKEGADVVIGASVEILEANNKGITISPFEFDQLSDSLKEKILQATTEKDIQEVNLKIVEEVEKAGEEAKKKQVEAIQKELEKIEKPIIPLEGSQEGENSPEVEEEMEDDSDSSGSSGSGGGDEAPLPEGADGTCDGTITTGIGNNIVISAGNTCTIGSVTISGNLFVEGTLNANGTTFNGNVNGEEGGSVDISSSQINGNVDSDDADIELSSSTVTGNVDISGGTASINGNTIAGNLTISSTSSCSQSGNTVNGNNSGCP
jgi:hypothetical protein